VLQNVSVRRVDTQMTDKNLCDEKDEGKRGKPRAGLPMSLGCGIEPELQHFVPLVVVGPIVIGEG